MFIDIRERAAFERAFNCRVIAWAEPTDDEGALRFEVVSRGRRIVADTRELLALELSAPAPYSIAA